MLVQKLTRNITLSIFILGFCMSTQAEGNLPYVDGKLIHFGFSLGMNAMDFGIKPADSVRVSNLSPGFSVGIISDLRLTRYLNLRFTPTLHFGDRTLNYRFTDSIPQSISSVIISLPFYLKYSAERKGNYRPYLIGGGGISTDLGRDTTKPVVLQPVDFFVEFGVGCDIYFSFFKLAPELKFGVGLNNILTPINLRNPPPGNTDDNKYTDMIQRLTSRMLTLTFNFE